MSEYTHQPPDRPDGTAQRLAEQGKQADFEAYRRVLEQVPDVPPMAGDELPDENTPYDDQP